MQHEITFDDLRKCPVERSLRRKIPVHNLKIMDNHLLMNIGASPKLRFPLNEETCKVLKEVSNFYYKYCHTFDLDFSKINVEGVIGRTPLIVFIEGSPFKVEGGVQAKEVVEIAKRLADYEDIHKGTNYPVLVYGMDKEYWQTDILPTFPGAYYTIDYFWEG